jgi:RNA polymerase primary sigma factor
MQRENSMIDKKKETEEATVERAKMPDGPLIDLSVDAVKKMVRLAKKRGFITMDELNSVLPADETDPDKIEDTLALLSEMGINVVEEAETEEEKEPEEDSEVTDLVEASSTSVAVSSNKREAGDRTDDPVRMYLREMGAVELL